MSGVRWAAFRTLRALSDGLYTTSRVLGFLAAGTLGLAELRRAIEGVWAGFMTDEGSIAEGLQPWEREFYGRFLPHPGSVLLVGSGSGRDLLGLLQLGHRVEGVELSPRAAARSRRSLRRSGLAADVHVAAIEEWTPPGRYDAIAFSWFCYSYILVAQRRIAMLARLRERLTSGGRLLICYLPRRGPTSRGVELVGWLTRLTRSDWRVEAGDEVVTGGGLASIHFEHLFRPEEIEAEARAAGLTVVWHQTTPQALLVLERADPARGESEGARYPTLRTPR